MEYKDIFSAGTLSKLNSKSADNLRTIMGDKSLMDTMMSSQELMTQIAEMEAPYKKRLEQIAVGMVKELYPIIDEEGIKIEASLGDLESISNSLDEIKVNKPGIKNIYTIRADDDDGFYEFDEEQIKKYLYTKYHHNESDDFMSDDRGFSDEAQYFDNPENSTNEEVENWVDECIKHWGGDMISMNPVDEDDVDFMNEVVSPESRRRIINSITQGSAVRGTFAFYLFKEHLDKLNPELVSKYNQLMKEVFGVYDDPNGIALMLSMLAQGGKIAGGSSKVVINEIKVHKPLKFKPGETVTYGQSEVKLSDGTNPYHNFHVLDNNGINRYLIDDPITGVRAYSDEKYLRKIKGNINESEGSGITIKAQALNFPMLVHEIIKGLYELISLQGFKGDKASNQQVVNKVDTLENEPEDIKYGKFIYDALNEIFANSTANPKAKEFFFTEVYQLENENFLEFIENAINENLTKDQKWWVKTTLSNIEDDMREDDFDKQGLDEIKVVKPGFPKDIFSIKIPSSPKPGQLFKDWIEENGSRIEFADKRASGFSVKIYDSGDFPSIDVYALEDYWAEKYPEYKNRVRPFGNFLKNHKQETSFFKSLIAKRNKIIMDVLKDANPNRIQITNYPDKLRFNISEHASKFIIIPNDTES